MRDVPPAPRHLYFVPWGQNVIKGAMEFNPESETDFFVKIFGLRLTFIKNDKGQVTGVIHHFSGLPDVEGKKLD